MMTTVSLPASVRLALACMISTLAESTHGQPLLLRTETFDADPGWDGRNNRATDPAPRQIVQNFGFSASTSNAGGSAGEIGGFITPAGEPAFYGKIRDKIDLFSQWHNRQGLYRFNGLFGDGPTTIRPRQSRMRLDFWPGRTQTLGYSRSLKHLCPALATGDEII